MPSLVPPGGRIIFPQANVRLRDYLAACMAGELVLAGDVPKVRPNRFVLIDRTGGVQESPFVDKPQLVIEAWDNNKLAAGQLIEDAKAWFLMAQPPWSGFFGPEALSLPAHLPDPTTAQHRFTMTVSMRVQGSLVP